MNVEIAQRLAELRREKGFSQEELAERIGLSRQAVSKWERAESSPDTGNLIALAKLYGVTLDELLRVDADIEDDVKFESQDRATSAEFEAKIAAEEANVAAAQAQVAAAQAKQAAQAQAAQAQAATATRAQQQVYGAQTAHVPHEHVPYVHNSQYAQHAAGVGTPPSHQPQTPTAPMYSEPLDENKGKGPWLTFPYPILCVIVFLCAGFFMGAWHPGWVVFLTIPLYYWIAHIIENDPNYRK